MPTDSERLDWLEAQADRGMCPAILFDDGGRWAVTYDGMQPFPDEGGFTETVQMVLFVGPQMWRDSLRAAIDADMEAADAA